MKNLIDYIQEHISNKHISDFISKVNIPDRSVILEMAQVGRNVRLGSKIFDLAIHGTNAGDRPYPHLHIYGNKGDKSFDFEISLVDLVCDDEINLISMKDKSNNINRRNRNICSWEGYRRMFNDFEEWLYSKSNLPGDYIDNVDSCIFWYNNESYMDNDNPFLEYIKNQGKKIHKEYCKYFSKEDKDKYKECFD